MSPEAGRFLDKGRKLLAEADAMLGIGLNAAAARTTYLAGYHAAQALIFERLKRVLKTHNGVQSEFLRLTKDDSRVDGELRLFLSRSYNLKAIADYETGPDADISPERAAQAVETGKRFVSHIASLVTTPIAAPDSGG